MSPASGGPRELVERWLAEVIAHPLDESEVREVRHSNDYNMNPESACNSGRTGSRFGGPAPILEHVKGYRRSGVGPCSSHGWAEFGTPATAESEGGQGATADGD